MTVFELQTFFFFFFAKKENISSFVIFGQSYFRRTTMSTVWKPCMNVRRALNGDIEQWHEQWRRV